MLSQTVFTAFVAAIALQRVAELKLSRRNEQRLRTIGAVEHARWQVTMLAVLHGSWLISTVAEVWILQPVFRPWLATFALLVFAIGQLLRLTAISTLGSRWTVSVHTLPSTRRVSRGLYSRLPHPNYIGVVLEMAALPLIHGAIATAIVFSVLNAIALVLRVDVEARALAEAER